MQSDNVGSEGQHRCPGRCGEGGEGSWRRGSTLPNGKEQTMLNTEPFTSNTWRGALQGDTKDIFITEISERA